VRKKFFERLANEMERDPRIWLLVGDLGWGLTADIERRFPDRFINMGVAEQLMIGAAIGLTNRGKRVVCYSITTFCLYRPFELLRTYVNHENIPIKLACSGRDRDYLREGFSHWSEDAKPILDTLPKIRQFFPADEAALDDDMMTSFLYDHQPAFISLSK
jgi:transketolase